MELLKDPFYNALFSGIIIYCLIKLTNKGNPVLGAIMSSLPIGLFGLIAIKKSNNIQNFYIRSELITNIIIIIMWIVINYLITNKEIKFNKTIMAGFCTWLFLSILFYTIANKYLKKL